MTKYLKLPCESGIKNALLEMLITVAHTDSYLCESAYTHILCVGDRKKYRVQAQGFACSSICLSGIYYLSCNAGLLHIN